MRSPAVEAPWGTRLARTLATELMEPSPLTVRAGTRLSDVRQVLDRHNTSVVMVLDARDRALGWVRRGDVAPDSTFPHGGRLDDGTSRWLDTGSGRMEHALDVLVPLVAYVHHEATLGEAVQLMCKEELGYLPVLDRTYRLKGILETRYVLAWIARRAGYVVSS